MPYCPKCGAELDEKARFCPKCGASAGLPATKPKRRIPREQRRPMSPLSIILIVLLVAVVIVATALATAFSLGLWQPFGQIVGSEELVTQEKLFSDFSIVEVEDGFEVEIIQSSSYSIKITADDNVIDYVEVFKRSDTLTIRLRWGYSYQSVTLKAKITMPELYELELSGGTYCAVKEFNTSHEFVLDLSGGSHLTGGFTTSGNVDFTLSGGSQLTGLGGSADNLSISASSGSHLDLSNFHVHDAYVDLSGGSHATIKLDGRLDADLSGGSNLQYIGDPTLGDIDTSGGSTISRK